MAYRTMRIILSDEEFEVLYQVAQNADRKPADQARHIVREALGMLPPEDLVDDAPPETRHGAVRDILAMLSQKFFKDSIEMLGYNLMLMNLSADMQHSKLLIQIHKETEESVSKAVKGVQSAAMALASIAAAYYAEETPEDSEE